MTIPALPAQSNTNWYAHYTALDSNARAERKLPGTSTRAQIQTALDAGSGAVIVGPGSINIDTALIVPADVQLIFRRTYLVAVTGGMDAVIKMGNAGSVDRCEVQGAIIKCEGQATTGIDCNIVGTTGNDEGEPDGQPRIMNNWVYDATGQGIWLRGGDTQAWICAYNRVRRAVNYAFRVQAPDGWLLCNEGTTTGTSGAGLFINTSNIHSTNNKMWYCGNYGFHIQGTRNHFTGDESQDTRNHGWFIDWDKNTYSNCIADSAAYADVGGTMNGADGFFLSAGLTETAMSNCQSFDREQGFPAQQRYGFNMSASTYNIGRTTVATSASTGTGTTPVLIGNLSGGDTTTANWKNVSGLLNLR